MEDLILPRFDFEKVDNFVPLQINFLVMFLVSDF